MAVAEPIGAESTVGSPNKNWNYHAIIVAHWHKKGNTLQNFGKRIATHHEADAAFCAVAGILQAKKA